MWKYCNLIGSFFKYSILIGSPLYWPILLLWFTSCLLSPMDKHLEEYDLLEGEQRGAKPRCSGTTDNLLVDRMVCHDSRNSRKNVSMAWIDVRKAFDSVSHEWLLEMMFLHKFPSWLCNTIKRLCQSWNTKITVRTRQGMETSDVIHFNKGLPQSDALCPRLFKLSQSCIVEVEGLWRKSTISFSAGKYSSVSHTNSKKERSKEAKFGKKFRITLIPVRPPNSV